MVTAREVVDQRPERQRRRQPEQRADGGVVSRGTQYEMVRLVTMVAW
jgi:hypothetical protein